MLDQTATAEMRDDESNVVRWDYTNHGGSAEPASLTLDRRLRQAAGLSAMLYGEGLEVFNGLNQTIQDDILWLLHDTICDAMCAREKEQDERRAANKTPTVRK